jgi:branched-chain amino acid transport system permease protein
VSDETEGPDLPSTGLPITTPNLDGPTYDIIAAVGLVALVVVLQPLVSAEFLLGYGTIANTILIWMLFAASYNLLLGYTGLLSFGHAAFLATGMYIVASTMTRLGSNLFLPSVALALVTGAVSAYLIARLIIHKGEIYFALLTFAFAEMYTYVAVSDPYGLTGGPNGIGGGVLPPWIESRFGEKFVVFGGTQFDLYWLNGAVFVVAIYLLFRIVQSPFGRTLIAIRENAELAKSIGVDVERYKTYSFTISAVFATLAGIMLVVHQQGVTTSILHWSTSGDVLLMVVIGGPNSFVGPLVGAFFWMFSADYLTSFEVLHLPLKEFSLVSYDVSGLMEYWRFLFGLTFIIVILLRPDKGVWGLVKNGSQWIRSNTIGRWYS